MQIHLLITVTIMYSCFQINFCIIYPCVYHINFIHPLRSIVRVFERVLLYSSLRRNANNKHKKNIQPKTKDVN